MIPSVRAIAAVFTLTAMVPAQEAQERTDAEERSPDDTKSLKVPLVEPVSVLQKPSLSVGALRPEQKGKLMLKNTFGVYALLNRALMASASQWSNDPEEWEQGWDAYGKRLANRMGQMAIRNTIRLGLDIALKTDPRYDRCECSGRARLAHAGKRVVVARNDYGGETFDTARVVSGIVTPWVAHEWYPPRLNTTERKLFSGLTYLGWRALNNVVAEFWPEVKQRLLRRQSSTWR